MSSKKAAKKKAAPTPEAAARRSNGKSDLPIATTDAEVYQRTSNHRPWYIALLIVGLVALIASTAMAFDGSVNSWERLVFTEINSMSAPGWVTSHLAKSLSNAVWGMAVLVAVLLLIPKYRLLAWQYAVAAGSTYTAVFILEHLISRGRPAGFNFDLVLRATQDGAGFPSGHVAVLAALVLTLWPYTGWIWRAVLVVLVAAEAWARMYLGVHWPLDVIGGAAVAATAVAVIHLMPAKILRFFRISA